jgi:homoserine dehydrogenase
VRIILVGFGVVGRSFAELLTSEKGKLAKDFGIKPKVVAIADAKGAATDPDGLDMGAALASKERHGDLSGLGDRYHTGRTGMDVISEMECEVVVESTPTELKRGEPGLSHVRSAMKEGRHVICTNKGPLALAMPALIELAQHNGVVFKFSGTVGGGTPVLDFAKKCLEGSDIRAANGILNGTSNYILTRMTAEGLDMASALADAQRLGYAEADPTYDIEGFDTACKLVITANYVLGTSLSLRDVSIKGITQVTMDQIEAARADGKVIKLIGSRDGSATVSPKAIPALHPLNVSGTFNAISFDTRPAGEFTLVGKGAGGPETASSVIRDLIEVRRAFAR